jgi:hypothetical protein
VASSNNFTPVDRSKQEVLRDRKSNLGIIEEESDTEDISIDWGQRKRLFFLFVMGNLFLNYDNGVIPACLLQMEKELKFRN